MPRLKTVGAAALFASLSCGGGGGGTGPGTLAYIKIAPDSTIIFAGLQRQFAAYGVQTDSDSVAVSATFSATGGTVSANGIYTAGSTPGNYLVVATAQGFVDTAKVTVNPLPPPGSFTTIVGDDWLSYANTDSLLAHTGWSCPNLPNCAQTLVNLVPDATFGQVARITQPFNDTVAGSTGISPEHRQTFSPRDRVWYRFRMKFSPGWTTAGNYPVGSNNAYKIAFITWSGATSRIDIVFANTVHYLFGFDQAGITATETHIATPGWYNASVTTEWTGAEWWEFIIYFERISPTYVRVRFWRRQLTSGGTIVNNPFDFDGWEYTNPSSPFVQAGGIALGVNKNNTTSTVRPAQDQYIYWGPFQVVDGSVYPNPFGVGP